MDGFMLEEGVQVGDCNTILGTLDGVPYNLWAMKETDYIMKMMVCDGLLQALDSCKETVRKWKENGLKVVR
jgi:hypothetical protein